MGPTKLALFSLMSTWPIVGKHCRAKVAEQLLDTLDKVEKAFTSPVIRFVDNIAFLSRSFTGFDWTLQEDLRLYKSLRCTTFTRTTNAAHTLLERLKEEGSPPNFENYFKDSVASNPTPFLDWYSNEQTLMSFISNSILLLEVYTLVNTPSDETTVYRGKEPTASYSTLEFFKSRYFKLLVLDLIESLRIVLNLEVRGEYEKGQKRT